LLASFFSFFFKTKKEVELTIKRNYGGRERLLKKREATEEE
jgi:hypothetical protein